MIIVLLWIVEWFDDAISSCILTEQYMGLLSFVAVCFSTWNSCHRHYQITYFAWFFSVFKICTLNLPNIFLFPFKPYEFWLIFKARLNLYISDHLLTGIWTISWLWLWYKLSYHCPKNWHAIWYSCSSLIFIYSKASSTRSHWDEIISRGKYLIGWIKRVCIIFSLVSISTKEKNKTVGSNVSGLDNVFRHQAYTKHGFRFVVIVQLVLYSHAVTRPYRERSAAISGKGYYIWRTESPLEIFRVIGRLRAWRSEIHMNGRDPHRRERGREKLFHRGSRFNRKQFPDQTGCSILGTLVSFPRSFLPDKDLMILAALYTNRNCRSKLGHIVLLLGQVIRSLHQFLASDPWWSQVVALLKSHIKLGPPPPSPCTSIAPISFCRRCQPYLERRCHPAFLR